MPHQHLHAEREVASAAAMHQTPDAVLFCCRTPQLCLVPLVANFRDVNAPAQDDLLSGALFCRHKDGTWNPVSI